MSLIQRWLSRSRIKDAKKQLAQDSSAKSYLALAHEFARVGEMDDVRRVCEEALALHPGHAELQRLCDRARAILFEAKTRRLTAELKDAPRPALYRDLSNLFLETGRLDRAESTADEWYRATGDPQAHLVRARARVQRFLTDKRREDGRVALEMLDAAEQLLPRDERPLRMRLDLVCTLGAWRDARKIVGQLLELSPGDPALEARFRTYNGLAERAPTVDAALRDIERSGHFAAEHSAPQASSPSARSIRPMLQELAAQSNVDAALFERGSTALVQGKKGATAERNARAVREIVHKTRTTARRLGLGAPLEIEIEGQFASVFIAPSEQGSAAVWCSQPTVPATLRGSVLGLIGVGIESGAEDPS